MGRTKVQCKNRLLIDEGDGRPHGPICVLWRGHKGSWHRGRYQNLKHEWTDGVGEAHDDRP